MKLRIGMLSVAVALAASNVVYAEESQDLNKAREALSKQDDDADTERALEEVFEAAEKKLFPPQ